MGHSYGSIFLLACRVPQLGLHSGAILHRHILGGKFNADCWCDRLGQRILEVAREKASLADIYIPDQND